MEIVYPPEGTYAKTNKPKTLQNKYVDMAALLTCKDPAKRT